MSRGEVREVRAETNVDNGRTETTSPLPLKSCKFSQKPLDKIKSLCYNKYVKKKRAKPSTKKGIDTMEKMTYVKALEIAIATVDNEEVKDKLTALKASIAKKNSAERKPTATQTANEGIKATIFDLMEVGTQYTVSDLCKALGNKYSNQKVSALVNAMAEANALTKVTENRKSYFVKA